MLARTLSLVLKASPRLVRPAIAATQLVAACLTAGVTTHPLAAQASSERTVVLIQVALVNADRSLRPVPAAAFQIQSVESSARAWAVRTTLSGMARVELPRGRYRLASDAPVRIGDSTYAWQVEFSAGDSTLTVELTQHDAQILPVFVDGGDGRQLSAEGGVFRRLRSGVVRIESGLGHGSGFLIAGSRRLVVTNDHVIGTDPTLSVVLDVGLRVPATVAYRDAEADLALLRIHDDACRECPTLALAAPGADSRPTIGERVLAIGFPLNQDLTLTTGVVSSLQDGAVMSDVNANPGNSGGPLLNLAGEVIGVVTFGDMARASGPGITGAVSVSALHAVLSEARTALDASVAPAADTLPMLPRDRIPLPMVRAVADSATMRAYRSVLGREFGGFGLYINTPYITRALERTVSFVALDRARREERAGLLDEDRYLNRQQARDWDAFVGRPTTPVVGVQIEPLLGETGGSTLIRALGAAVNPGTVIPATIRARGDLREARFYRNGVEITPLRGGHSPMVYFTQNMWVELSDVADRGYYVLPVEAFAPDSDGTPAVVTIIVRDLKNPFAKTLTDIYGDASARIWNDFVPFLESQPGRGPVRRADARRARLIPITCDERTLVCRRLPDDWRRGTGLAPPAPE